MNLQQTIEANIRLRCRKDCVIPEQLALLLIKQKNHNKRFGEFEFEYFGDFDVVNKLDVSKNSFCFKADPLQSASMDSRLQN